MDIELPQAFQQLTRTAKKQHTCCECRRPIHAGDKYEYSSGVWDGKPDSFKTCLSCVEIRDEYTASTGEPTAFGDLGSTIHETFSRGFGPREYAEQSGIALERIMVFFPDYYEDESEDDAA